MEEQLISIEVAKLAKEKGFDIPCKFVVNKEGYEDAPSYTGEDTFSNFEVKNAIDNTEEEHYLAPTQSLLAKWLREVHEIHIEIMSPDAKDENWRGTIRKINKYYILADIERQFDNYEDCLERGLLQALKLI